VAAGHCLLLTIARSCEKSLGLAERGPGFFVASRFEKVGSFLPFASMASPDSAPSFVVFLTTLSDHGPGIVLETCL
jgi:hypothetical protein